MPIRALLLYIAAKHKEKTQWQNYIADCLWASATGRTFSDKDKATLPRWYEIIRPKEEQRVITITKEDVKSQFARLKGG